MVHLGAYISVFSLSLCNCLGRCESLGVGFKVSKVHVILSYLSLAPACEPGWHKLSIIAPPRAFLRHAHRYDGHGIMSPELNGLFLWVSLVPVSYQSNGKETQAAGEGTYHQAGFLKLGGGRRGRTPPNCLQTCTRPSWHTCTNAYINKSINLNKTYAKDCLKGL